MGARVGIDGVESAVYSLASSFFSDPSFVDGPRRDIDAIGGSRGGNSLVNDGYSSSPDRMQESLRNHRVEEGGSGLAKKLSRAVLPFESSQVRYLQFILDYFISPHVIKVCENKRDNETSFALPLMYIANLYETLVREANARVDSELFLLRGGRIGLPLEAAGGLYRELSKKFPKKGSCMYKRRELAAAETREKYPELVIPEETRIRFVVVYGLDIVEKPDNVPIEDAEWFKLVTGRNEVVVSARDYKFYCPRPKLKRDQNSVFGIHGLPMSNDGGVNDGGAEDDVGGSIRRKKQKQIVWEDEYTGIYLELLDMELAKIRYKQKLPKEVGRERICKGFLEKTGISLPWEFFKNHYNNLRNKYESYKRLANFAGVSADHNTGLIDMDSEWWDGREKEIEYAKQIRVNGIPHMELMRRIFGRQEAMYSTHKQDEREPMDNAADDDSNIVPTSDVHLQSQTISLESPPMDKSVPETQKDNAADDDSNIVPTSDVHLQSQTFSQESLPMSPIGPSKRSNREQSRVTTPYESSNRGKDVSQSREENIPYKEAYGILQSIQGLTRWTDFWWSCIKVLKEDSFARDMMVYNESDDDRITFLEVIQDMIVTESTLEIVSRLCKVKMVILSSNP